MATVAFFASTGVTHWVMGLHQTDVVVRPGPTVYVTVPAGHGQAHKRALPAPAPAGPAYGGGVPPSAPSPSGRVGSSRQAPHATPGHLERQGQGPGQEQGHGQQQGQGQGQGRGQDQGQGQQQGQGLGPGAACDRGGGGVGHARGQRHHWLDAHAPFGAQVEGRAPWWWTCCGDPRSGPDRGQRRQGPPGPGQARPGGGDHQCLQPPWRDDPHLPLSQA